MVDKVDSRIQYVNKYNTVSSVVQTKPAEKQPDTCALTPAFTASKLHNKTKTPQANIRTELSGRGEKSKYTKVSSFLDRKTRKTLNNLLKAGILLNQSSNDNSTVLDNLYKIVTEPRAQGLSREGILKDTISTLEYPFIITQQFGDIPSLYRQKVLEVNADDEHAKYNIDVDHSGTCPAASIEFNLAQKMPAEFARFAQGLSSEKMSVSKTIKMRNLAESTLDAIWLLNAFEVPYTADNFNEAHLTFAPDKKAIVRAQIQTTHKDPYERSALDVLMQSTFMQIGSQQSYNSITDKRYGKFNQNDKGLIEFEKTFTESVVADKSTISVIYQSVDENGRLVGYETDFETMKNQLVQTLDEGENIILGYTYVDENNMIIGGHEITLIGYRKNSDGKLTFICNDTDDNLPKPIEYKEDDLLPKIHHAGLPERIVAKDLNMTPNWVEGVENFKKMRQAA